MNKKNIQHNVLDVNVTGGTTQCFEISCYRHNCFIQTIQIIHLKCCNTFAKLHHLLLSELDIEYFYEGSKAKADVSNFFIFKGTVHLKIIVLCTRMFFFLFFFFITNSIISITIWLENFPGILECLAT